MSDYIEIKPYTADSKSNWNQFLGNSRIDSFLLNRDFMEYHSDRFEDASLLIFRKGKLDAIVPANRKGDQFYTHQGLTYGGIILSKNTSATDVLLYFEAMNAYLKEQGITQVTYKSIPFIYHKYFAEEDRYALFRLGAQRIACNLSSTIDLKRQIPFIESRKSGLRKAKANALTFEETTDFDSFWTVLEENLKHTHGAKPVHTAQETALLHSRFPKQISCYVVKNDSQILGGTVLFIMDQVVHVQYISANLEGKNLGALDLLFDYLIHEKYAQSGHLYFDFGQSTEQQGHFLNENLIFQKEGFGGRGVNYEIYEYAL